MSILTNIITATSVVSLFSAGGFIYLAASELIPEMQKETSFKKSVVQFVMFILGIVLIWYLEVIFPE